MSCNCKDVDTGVVAKEAERRLRDAHRLYGFAVQAPSVSEGLVRIVLDVVREIAEREGGD